MLQCIAVRCSVLQRVAVCCSVLQCVTACCSVLQRVAVCCIVYNETAASCRWHTFSFPLSLSLSLSLSISLSLLTLPHSLYLSFSHPQSACLFVYLKLVDMFLGALNMVVQKHKSTSRIGILGELNELFASWRPSLHDDISVRVHTAR